jgi:hypothetical protein
LLNARSSSEVYGMGLDPMRRACEDDRSYEPVMKGIGELQRELSAMNAVSGAKPAASVGAKASRLPDV